MKLNTNMPPLPTGEGARGERLRLIAQRFTKAQTTYPREATVQHQIAGKMTRLLKQYLPEPACREVVEFGCGTGTYSRMLQHFFRPERLLLNDICDKMQESCKDLLESPRITFLPGDAESIPFPKETGLITSCSTLQWFERPAEFFKKCNGYLQSHGYFAFSTFGQENMKEIRQLTGHGLTYRSKEELETLLAPFYDIIHSEEEIISLTFSTPMQVLYHLKQTGVTGTASQTWTRSRLNLFCTEYRRLFSTKENSVSITYHPIYIIAKKRQTV